RSRQKPALNILGDFQVAFHHHPVRQFQQQYRENQQRAPKVQIQLLHVDLAGAAAICESERRKEQEDQPEQQQHAPRGRQLLDDCPEQRLEQVPRALTPRLTLQPLAYIRRIKPIA